jgi:hypothetical protein
MKDAWFSLAHCLIARQQHSALAAKLAPIGNFCRKVIGSLLIASGGAQNWK